MLFLCIFERFVISVRFEILTAYQGGGGVVPYNVVNGATVFDKPAGASGAGGACRARGEAEDGTLARGTACRSLQPACTIAVIRTRGSFESARREMSLHETHHNSPGKYCLFQLGKRASRWLTYQGGMPSRTS